VIAHLADAYGDSDAGDGQGDGYGEGDGSYGNGNGRGEADNANESELVRNHDIYDGYGIGRTCCDVVACPDVRELHACVINATMKAEYADVCERL
jgi:hypothetical protein